MTVVLDDCFFHDFHGYVGVVAGVVLSSAAEKVVVDAAVPAFGALYHEALFTAGTPNSAFEVVRVCALAGAGTAV